jgi:hypothetical protein
MEYYSKYATEKEGCCAWSLIATTSQILALSLLLLSDLMNISISLFVSHPCLTFLNSACTSFTPNQVYPLVHVYHRAISWQFRKRLPFALVELVYRWFRASSLHGVGPLSSHVIMISLVPSCLIAPMIDSVWKFLPRWVMSSSTLEFEKVLFHSEHPLELLDQEDWVMKHNTCIVMKHNTILQGAMSPTHERKSGMGDREVFLLSTVSISFLLCGQCIFHHFLFPSFINLGTRFLLRGRTVTPRVTFSLITFIKVVIGNQIHLAIQF